MGMYEEFFGLNSRPFVAAPRTECYFAGATIDAARKSLSRCIERGEGAGLIVGPSGTGKSLLCQLLADEFTSRFCVALLSSGRLGTRQALLQAILYELKLPYQGLNEGELRLALLDHLEPSNGDSSGLVLLVDEAHAMPLRLLEEVRMLTNLIRDGQPRVRVVLAGSSLLEERFASPKLASFSQRLSARCYLEPLDSAESREYVRFQIAGVGGDAGQLFDESALQSIYRATDGIPRLINQVCDHALILASLAGIRHLTSDTIDEAWADLQQLPAPWSRSESRVSGDNLIVEFSGLDDDLESTPNAIPFRSAVPEGRGGSMGAASLVAFDDDLGQIDHEFQHEAQPPGVVELNFGDLKDPFTEQFAEEEILLDRYSLNASLFAELPRVKSIEGEQMGSILAPWDTTIDSRQPSRRAGIKIGALAIVPAEERGIKTPDGPQPICDTIVAKTSAHYQEPSTELNASPRPTAFDASPLGPTPVIAGALARGWLSAGRDADLILIDQQPVAAAAARTISAEHKPQFRELFAKLRRGSKT